MKLGLALAALGFTACSGRQSALDPAGPYSTAIADLWWIFFGVCAIVWVLVVAFMLVATFRGRRDASERRLTLVIGVAAGVTVSILFVLLFLSTSTGNSLMTMGPKQPLMIHVTGQQWWWAVEYKDPTPVRQFASANEIYVPVGRPVHLVLKSRDVIHSFWIPNLHGKRDLIPGHTSSFVIQADRPGTYEGQCAEFCGLQHAKMRLSLTAVPEAEFIRWADSQRRAAKPPSTPLELRGQQVFLAGTCAMCHAISGTPAKGRSAPDLTHVGSRRMLAANSIPNAIGHMAGWIVDPQSIKPGNNMPSNPLPSDDLEALVAYLQSLK